VHAVGVATLACDLEDLSEIVPYFLFLDVQQTKSLDAWSVNDPRVWCSVV
jgi:hypothetical protein